MQKFEDYNIAEISENTVTEIKALEEKLRTELDEDVVLIAFKKK